MAVNLNQKGGWLLAEPPLAAQSAAQRQSAGLMGTWPTTVQSDIKTRSLAQHGDWNPL